MSGSRRRRTLIRVGVILAVVAITVVVCGQIVPQEAVTVQVAGDEGRPIRVAFVADGVLSEFEVTTPAAIEQVGRRVRFDVVPLDDKTAFLEVEIRVQDALLAMCRDRAVSGFIEGNSILNWGQPAFNISGVSDEDLERMRSSS